MRVDMEVLLECSTYVKHEKKNSIPTSSHVLFCLLYKHTNDDFFWRFSENFRKRFEDFRRFSKSCPTRQSFQCQLWKMMSSHVIIPYRFYQFDTTSTGISPVHCKIRFHSGSWLLFYHRNNIKTVLNCERLGKWKCLI